MSHRRLTILMVNKYYFIKGGSERCLFELTSGLERRGHRVVPFAMVHPRNYPSPWARHFVSDPADASALPGWASARRLGRAIYSLQARRRLSDLLQEVRPDVAHLHMIDHQISPSILTLLRSAGIPTLQTLHQYKSVCPNYRLYNERTGEICELCVGRSTVHAVWTRCHKASLAASAAVALESGIHRMLGPFGRPSGTGPWSSGASGISARTW